MTLIEQVTEVPNFEWADQGRVSTPPKWGEKIINLQRKVEQPKAQREALESGRKMMNTIQKEFESSGVLTIEGKLNTALAEEADEFIEVCATIFNGAFMGQNTASLQTLCWSPAYQRLC